MRVETSKTCEEKEAAGEGAEDVAEDLDGAEVLGGDAFAHRKGPRLGRERAVERHAKFGCVVFCQGHCAIPLFTIYT